MTAAKSGLLRFVAWDVDARYSGMTVEPTTPIRLNDLSKENLMTRGRTLRLLAAAEATSDVARLLIGAFIPVGRFINER